MQHFCIPQLYFVKGDTRVPHLITPVCVSCLVVSDSAAPRASLSMEFSRQEHWSGLPFPSPEGLPNPGVEPRSPALQEDSLLSEPPVKPHHSRKVKRNSFMADFQGRQRGRWEMAWKQFLNALLSCSKRNIKCSKRNIKCSKTHKLQSHSPSFCLCGYMQGHQNTMLKQFPYTYTLYSISPFFLSKIIIRKKIKVLKSTQRKDTGKADFVKEHPYTFLSLDWIQMT